jgi:hypothetical protein
VTVVVDRGSVRLAELVATLSLATDLGRGEPMEHCLRQTVLALRIADRIGVDERDRVATYYTGLIANVYCHADAHEQAELFGDDILAKHGAYDPNLFEFLRMIGASERGYASGAGSSSTRRSPICSPPRPRSSWPTSTPPRAAGRT